MRDALTVRVRREDPVRPYAIAPGEGNRSSVRDLRLYADPSSGYVAPSLEAPLSSKLVITTGGLPARVSKLGALEIRDLVRKVDQISHSTPDLALQGAEVGSNILVGVEKLRPGQTQLSYDRVRDKMQLLLGRVEGKTVAKIERKSKEALPFTKPTDFRAVIGPGGRYLVLVDGHHKLSATFALMALLDSDGKKKASIDRTPERSALGRMIDRDEPQVSVHVVDNLSHLSEEAFWQTMKDRGGMLYLDRRGGPAATLPPRRFSDLENNPYRCLAGQSGAKVHLIDGKPGGFELEVTEEPALWIKGPNAPDFIEFHVARVLEEPFSARGETYRPGKPLTLSQRKAAHQALMRVASDRTHPEYPYIHDLPVLPTHLPVESKDLEDFVRVGRKKGKVKIRKKKLVAFAEAASA